MPPRFAYWTIILDGAPTSFRMKDRDEILPLFNQLKAKNPGALLKWFSGGTLWDSPEQAREARETAKVRLFREERAKEAKEQREGREDPLAEFRRQHGRPADGSDQKPPATSWSPGSSDPGSPRAPRGDRPRSSDRRGRDWRPGGEHRDPRDKYKLPPGEARKRWKDRNLGPRPSTRDAQDRPPRTGGPKPFGRERWSPGSSDPGSPKAKPHGTPKPFGQKPFGRERWSPGSSDPGSPKAKPHGTPKPFGQKPFGSKPGGDRPYGDRPRGPKPFGQKSFGSKPGGSRPFGDRPRGPKPFGPKPGGNRPRGGKPPGGPRRKG